MFPVLAEVLLELYPYLRGATIAIQGASKTANIYSKYEDGSIIISPYLVSLDEHIPFVERNCHARVGNIPQYSFLNHHFADNEHFSAHKQHFVLK